MQPVLERGDAATAPGRGGPRVRGRDRLRRPGALLPRDPLLAGDGRRERPGVRAVQHPAPDRDAGDHRPRARRAEPPRHRAVPADGRRVRRQGDAAPRARRGRRAGRDADRSPRAGAADPPAGHHDDRQATRLPRELAGRLRRRRTHPRAGGDADLRRRLEPRPLRTRAVARAVPRRERLLDPRHPRAGPDREDQQDLADGVPRLRRAAGHARHRGHHRPLRTAARARARRDAPPQLLRRGPDHALRPARAPPRADGARVGPGPGRQRLRTTPARGRGVQRGPPAHQAGPGDHAGEVRHLLQLHLVQPGRRAGARLQGRLGADQPRRHRDGPGPAHQDAPGGGHRARRTSREGAPRADPHRQGAQHLGHRRQCGRRPQRRCGQGRVRADPRPAPRRASRAPGCVVGGAGRPRPTTADPAVGGRLLQDRGAELGRRDDDGLALQVLRLRRRRLRGRGRRLHRRLRPAPRRHRPRRRRQPVAAGRPRAGRGRVRARCRVADAGGPALGHLRRARAADG